MSRSLERNTAEGDGVCSVRNIVAGGGVPDLTYQELIREMDRLLKRRLEPMQEQLDYWKNESNEKELPKM
ncbi:hypothetical protein J1N35_018652 [Gossypium stocksii]|uniref:Uncharacterized protein n=1 Tax=Gossypium stocksii TaxID=47602 RepID=A0A9D3VQY9_9ROSI|nr:hypothetical protein J1N35_018652 [Gossypium stocksii]